MQPTSPAPALPAQTAAIALPGAWVPAHRAARRGCAWAAVLGLAAVLSACAPALDWRDVNLGAGPVQGLFPCKPTVQERKLELAGRMWSASLQACDAGEHTFAALSLRPVEEAVSAGGPPPSAAATPAAARPVATEPGDALSVLVETARARWGMPEGEQQAPSGVKLPPALQGTWVRHSRAVQDARAVVTHAVFFAHGPQLHQLSVSAMRVKTDAVEPFFGQLRVTP